MVSLHVNFGLVVEDEPFVYTPTCRPPSEWQRKITPKQNMLVYKFWPAFMCLI